jgi:hypothetical protein
MPMPMLSRRVAVDDVGDIVTFATTLSQKMEAHLPTVAGHSVSLLSSTMTAASSKICQAGRNNRNTYGPSWSTAPGLKLLGNMLADCAVSMDKMDQFLLSFYTQDEINAGPEGVLFLKFAGIMYCNRIIAMLVNDPSSLDKICSLVP